MPMIYPVMALATDIVAVDRALPILRRLADGDVLARIRRASPKSADFIESLAERLAMNVDTGVTERQWEWLFSLAMEHSVLTPQETAEAAKNGDVQRYLNRRQTTRRRR